MSRQRFIIEGRDCGSRVIETMRRVPGLEVRPQHSFAYFCMRCGDVWAKLDHEAARLTQCTVRPCRRHGDGRVSTDWWPDLPTHFEDDWPPAAVRHEFLCFLEQAERELKERRPTALEEER